MAGGLDVLWGNALLTATHKASGTSTVGTLTYTGPTNVRIMTANGADSNHKGTELGTGSSYTAAGAGLGAPTWSAAGTVSNAAAMSTSATLTKTGMPAAASLVGLEEYDSSGTPQRLWWGPVTGFATNIGDSVALTSLTDTLA